ncbi:hypothetical protein [Companilactobacillus kimchiensis]|uniref:Uncharacterized protein n=1 Tax=Companilactobacillus kimchiensis TaxID=993692 RepID=A0A0R2LBU4_9LACO|nr:hypothetical protein [Companilactobacillus kimchiensis]KRN99406.1 hypothetical protein IV57_GL002530 [Companilactobacillus kimchiensis]
MAMKINKKFYKRFGFWVGLSLVYEAIGIFKGPVVSINAVINIISLVLGLGAIYFALFDK